MKIARLLPLRRQIDEALPIHLKGLFDFSIHGEAPAFLVECRPHTQVQDGELLRQLLPSRHPLTPRGDESIQRVDTAFHSTDTTAPVLTDSIAAASTFCALRPSSPEASISSG